MNRPTRIRTARHLQPTASWLPAALAFLFLTLSCQKSPLDSPQDTPTDTQIPIEFGVADNWTKATIATEDVLKDPTNGGFKVWAWFQGSGDGGHMFTADGTKVTWQNNEWTYSPARYWINGTYDFFAVYPESLAEQVIYDEQNKHFALSYNVSNQADVLVATPTQIIVDGTEKAESVVLNFEHALCQLEFQAKAVPIDLGDEAGDEHVDNNAYQAVLSGIEIRNAAISADYTFIKSENGYNWDASTHSYPSDGVTYKISKESSNLAKLYDTATGTYKAEVYETGIMMIPQAVDDVSVRVIYKGGFWEGYIPKPKDTDGWVTGKKYTYLVSIDQNANITFMTPIVTDWVKASGGNFIIDTSGK